MNRIIFALFLLMFYGCLKPENKVEEVVPKPKLTYQEEALILVNNIRTSGVTCGTKVMPAVGKLVLNEKLNEVSLAHSKDMDAKNYFAHTNKEGKSPRDRIRAAGYQDLTYGENIYMNTFADAEFAVEAWKVSPGHCLNMMNPAFKEMGIGNYNSYWTQLLATKN